MPAVSEPQRKLFGAALAAKRGAKPISKKIAKIAKQTPEKELSKMASKDEGVEQQFDNQVGDMYAVQKPYDGCASDTLVHKIDPLMGINGAGIDPMQVYGAYLDEKAAMVMAEKLYKEFTDAGIMLEKKKEAVIDRLKSAIDELEAKRSESVQMIKENPKEAGSHKETIAQLATKIDDLMTKLEKIEKSKKEIENKEDKKEKSIKKEAIGAKNFTYKDVNGKTKYVTANDIDQAKEKVKKFNSKIDLSTVKESLQTN